MTFCSGFIAIVGPPNVGKSTLLNRILGSKLAMVSPRPQATRNRLRGVLNGESFQMVFVDTPGIHETKTLLHKSMVESALATFMEVDIILLVIQMDRSDQAEIATIIRHLKGTGKPCILAINKIDVADKASILPVIDRLRHFYPFEAVIPISALKGDGVSTLLEELKARLEPGPRFFPEDMRTDQQEEFLVSEVIREKIYNHLRKELPYSSAVTVEKIKRIPQKRLVSIAATIHVESDSQKGIIIGKGGRTVRAIGTSVRIEMEKRYGTKVFLELKVKVEKGWSKDPKALQKLGY